LAVLWRLLEGAVSLAELINCKYRGTKSMHPPKNGELVSISGTEKKFAVFLTVVKMQQFLVIFSFLDKYKWGTHLITETVGWLVRIYVDVAQVDFVIGVVLKRKKIMNYKVMTKLTTSWPNIIKLSFP
jgi:hypothetical protein